MTEDEGDALCLRGYIKEFGETPSMTASRASIAEAKAERLQKALEFYVNNWKCKPNKRYGGLEYSPNEALLDDCGNTARAALGDPS